MILKTIANILPEDWIEDLQDSEGNIYWCTYVPFSCTSEEVLEVQLLDSQEYIDQNKETFDAIEEVHSLDGSCLLISNKQPECNISIEVRKQSDDNIQPQINDVMGHVFSHLFNNYIESNDVIDEV